jgi:hypothetical protein
MMITTMSTSSNNFFLLRARINSTWKDKITNKMTTPIVIILMIRHSVSRKYLLKKKLTMDGVDSKKARLQKRQRTKRVRVVVAK